MVGGVDRWQHGGSTVAAPAANECSQILTPIYASTWIRRIFRIIGSSAENAGTPAATRSLVVHALRSPILPYI